MITYSSPQFAAFAKYVLDWEGGLSRNPNDRAARFVASGQYHTNRGIIWPTFQYYAKSIGVAPTYENFISLTRDQCKQILWQFLLSVKGNQYKTPAIGLTLAEFAWGSGSGNAINHLQNALLSLKAPIRKTRAFDKQTIDAANSANQTTLYKTLWTVRQNFLLAIVSKDPAQKVFLKGWLNRVKDFQKNFPYNATGGGLLSAALIIGAALLFKKKSSTFLEQNSAIL
tara:strand:+ start:7923 stop:8603 length:681 start_codon:yes stop_codon:yes gene_type:complete